MTVDKNDGTIYVVWADSLYGDSDIFLVKSTNVGTSWSGRFRVNTDPVGNSKDQWFPWISIVPDGEINVIFYDSRNDPDNILTEVYLARSTDGGQSFQNIKISDTAFTPTDGYKGSYIGIGIASSLGRTYPCWYDNRSGIYQIYVSAVGHDAISITSPSPGTCIKGNIPLEVGFTDINVNSVSWKYQAEADGGWQQIGTSSIPPYIINWNTAMLPDNNYYLSTAVLDEWGNSFEHSIMVRKLPPSPTVDLRSGTMFNGLGGVGKLILSRT